MKLVIINEIHVKKNHMKCLYELLRSLASPFDEKPGYAHGFTRSVTAAVVVAPVELVRGLILDLDPK